MLRRLTPSRIALAALAISVLLLAVRVRIESRTESSIAYAQGSAPCGTDPSCGTVVEPPFPGDVNCDGVINELDVPVMISLVFDCNLCSSCNPLNADSNCDGLISVADIEGLAVPCTIGPTPTPTPGLDDCCQCDGTLCEVPAEGACPSGCDVAYDAACVDASGCIPNTVTPTRTPTLGANDCCVCQDNECSVPTNSACPSGCTPQRDSACTDTGACVANTPTLTPTPTLGVNDCCVCAGDTCSVPTDSACPSGCTPQFDSACTGTGACVGNTPTPTIVPTLGANDCCVCAGNTCSVPTDSACPTGCTPQFDSACTGTGACVANTPTPTTVPTLGANDCCVCAGNTCSVPTDAACPTGCTPQFDSACTGTGACVANTPTPTRTPTLGANDCCQCGGVECAVPSDSACPQGCNAVYDSACVAEVGCVANTVTPTLTPTLGANDCCVCEGNTCAVPTDSACPTGCTPQFDSACTGSGACVANTPTSTPTPTPTLGANDCCQCAGVECAVPTDSACPQGCNAVYDSACVAEAGCIANTVTPTLTPTLGANDCCVCAGNTCAVPTDAACPTGCTPQFDSACTGSGACVANTPTRTPTPTRTLTPTLGANDCCVCQGNSCAVPSDAACPTGCTPQYDSACTGAGACVKNTPTPTLTPTLGANDCCVCEGNTCAVPSDSSCPTGCTPQYDSACNDAGACTRNTPTPTRSRPPGGTATRTPTMTPMVIPFPC